MGEVGAVAEEAEFGYDEGCALEVTSIMELGGLVEDGGVEGISDQRFLRLGCCREGFRNEA